MKEKIITILKKYHLNHYGDMDKAVEELSELFNEFQIRKHFENEVHNIREHKKWQNLY